MAYGQSTLPSLSPTALPPNSSAAAEDTTHSAIVAYLGGRLEVTADNSSLNQILREVARQTGITITGGVKEERVFGKYGPGAPAKVLESLLDGTDSNILLGETSASVPSELILTPRTGGPSPPNPNARGYDGDARSAAPSAAAPPPALLTPQPLASPMPQPRGQTPPPVQAPGSVFNGAPNISAPGTIADTVPGESGSQPAAGAKTPQEIYQQLQQLRQAQPQPQTPPQ